MFLGCFPHHFQVSHFEGLFLGMAHRFFAQRSNNRSLSPSLYVFTHMYTFDYICIYVARRTFLAYPILSCTYPWPVSVYEKQTTYCRYMTYVSFLLGGCPKVGSRETLRFTIFHTHGFFNDMEPKMTYPLVNKHSH